jgi:hypothetical protein
MADLPLIKQQKQQKTARSAARRGDGSLWRPSLYFSCGKQRKTADSGIGCSAPQDWRVCLIFS